ncbi:hypothetical protein TESG_06389 [Trichophyton tonsurans CBS 112818]|uniref:C2H2-type domain-containing protein n=1 Tax=Trichophyton tonsurans (strain CBS 112818) TaxID=647933 RepID=F2S630_TRIT1|nr:hypothetical protein TESG_06389 [Trichophyton tonsurans CBS 112818]
MAVCWETSCRRQVMRFIRPPELVDVDLAQGLFRFNAGKGFNQLTGYLAGQQNRKLFRPNTLPTLPCPTTLATMTPMNAIRHRAPTFDCEVCNKTFRTQHAANQHMAAVGHWEEDYYPYECDTCTNRYASEEAVQRHMKDARHYRYYCKACDRKFANLNNLNMHLRSRVHVGNGVKCPFCQTGYATASGLAHHLERAACPNAPYMNRKPFFRKSVNVIRMGALPSSNSNGMKKIPLIIRPRIKLSMARPGNVISVLLVSDPARV